MYFFSYKFICNVILAVGNPIRMEQAKCAIHYQRRRSRLENGVTTFPSGPGNRGQDVRVKRKGGGSKLQKLVGKCVCVWGVQKHTLYSPLSSNCPGILLPDYLILWVLKVHIVNKETNRRYIQLGTRRSLMWEDLCRRK